jgi:hypothetical protein
MYSATEMAMIDLTDEQRQQLESGQAVDVTDSLPGFF